MKRLLIDKGAGRRTVANSTATKVVEQSHPNSTRRHALT
jgi:hypothetical protein